MHTNDSAGSAPVNVAQALLAYLRLEGVDNVFGIPGSALSNLLFALHACGDIKYVICRHETGAAFIADGYHRVTGKLGVVIVTSGPGATNALTGVVNAQGDGSSLLAITGEAQRQFFGQGFFQEGIDSDLDIDKIYSASTAASEVIGDPSEFRPLIERVLRLARSVPGRAVHISLPNDVSGDPIGSGFKIPASVSAYRTAPNGAYEPDVRLALGELLQAKRPLIFLGNGCRRALENVDALRALIGFVETYSIPVVTTGDAKGIFPESHAMSLRNYGFASSEWPSQWMAPEGGGGYDGLLVIASALLGLGTENWNPRMIPQGPLIQVDLDQTAIGRGFPVTRGIVAEAGAFIQTMARLGREHPPNDYDVAGRSKQIEAIRNTLPFAHADQYSADTTPLQPAAVVRVVQESLPKDAMIFLDPGNCIAWGIRYFTIDPPMRLHSSLAMAPMGFAVGGVVGAKLGEPERTCVALVGDGALLMHGAEISTAQAHKVGAIWVVFQDDDLHMVTQGMGAQFPNPQHPDAWDGPYRLGTPDLVRFAQGLGADACRADDLDGLQKAVYDAVEAAKSGRPQVIVVRIDLKSISPFFPSPAPPMSGYGIP